MSLRKLRHLLTPLLALFAVMSHAADRVIPPTSLRSGIEFAGTEVRRLQQDDFENPGMLWVTRGEQLWKQLPGKNGRSCASCHGEPSSMKGVSTRYPALDAPTGTLVNVEGRINTCRTRHQKTARFEPESQDLVALATLVTHQSRGMPIHVEPNPLTQKHFDRGRALFYTRIGQMNLACAHCHENNWGRRLLAETISQGHGNGYPAYRLEWQRVGTLDRRLRACFMGLRAEPPTEASGELVELELFLAWRATGMLMETPGVRR
jgi:sulfur-oxidizing protein SoxA